MANEEQIRITLKPLKSDIPVPQRIRMLLKHALRGLDLRCVHIDGGRDGEIPIEVPASAVDAPTTMYGS